ncbi:hypothetical protein [Serratia fonticola]
MLLSEFKLIEVINLETEFRQGDRPKGQGKVDFAFGSMEIEAGKVLSSDGEKSVITVIAEPKATGYRDGDTEEFMLRIKMRMAYACPSSYTLDAKFLKDSSWFFSGFLKAYFKMYADEILKQSGINGVKLPLN